MMLARRAVILLALATCLNAQAQDPKISDFAHRVNLVATPGLNVVELNEAIYRAARTADLRDLRVFNGNREALPLAPLPLPDIGAGPASEVRLVPLAAEPQARDRALADFALRIERNGARSVIELTPAGPAPAPVDDIGGYLLDLRPHEHMDGELKLQFAAYAEDFSGRIELLGSDDLFAWRPLASGPLVRNRRLGGTIERNSFAVRTLPPFVRVAWSGSKAPQIGAALFVARGTRPALPRAVLTVAPGDSTNSWLVDVPIGLPIVRVHVRAPRDNVSLRVQLLRYEESDAPIPARVHLDPRRVPKRWIAEGVHEVFRVYRDGQWTENPPFRLAAHTTQLRIDAVVGSFGDALPVVEAEWQPQRYLIAMREPPPYVLAIGSADSDLPRGPTLVPRSVLPGDDQAGVRLPVARLEVAPPAAEQAQRIARDASWSRYVLWSALLLAVVALSSMAWRIAQQLRARKTPD